MNKKILLVFPFSVSRCWSGKRDVRSIPMGITYIAASLKKAGYIVEIIDLEVERLKHKISTPENFDCHQVIELEKIFRNRINNFRPDVIGINCLYSGLFPSVVFLADLIKKINKKIIIEIGGIHPTTFPEEIIKQHQNIIDYILKGESEETFIKLMDAIFYSKHKFNDIEGLVCFKDNILINNTKKYFITNLDQLPFPAVELLDLSDYFFYTKEYYNPKNIPINTVVPILSSRSCPIGCNFCNMNLVHGKKIRYRTPENVVDEIQMYVEKYNLHYFTFIDDNLTINKNRLISIMNLIIKRNLNIQFSTDNGVYVNSLDEEALNAMVDAGLVRLSLAFETGSDYIRNKVIGKNLYNEKIHKIKDIIKNNKKFNKLYLYGLFVIGFPEETKQTLEDTWSLLTQFPLDNFYISYATPFPGTKLFNQCKEEKLFAKEYLYDLSKMVNSPDFYYESEHPHIKPYDLDVEELIDFKKKAFEYLHNKINNSNVPKNYPLRYND